MNLQVIILRFGSQKMAEVVEEDAIDPMEKLKSNHNKERKELNAKITALKHGVTKNDKKKKKEVAQEVEKLEAELKKRHETALRELEKTFNGMAVSEEVNVNNGEETSNGNTEVDKNGNNGEETSAPAFFKEVKLTKAQQKKENKRKKQAETRAIASAQDEYNAKNSKGAKESEALKLILAQRGLGLVEVRSDGDCLYNALAHQLRLEEGMSSMDATDLRKIAADYISDNSQDFLPFLVTPDGEPLDETELPDYCDRVEKMCAQGGNWGGEPELRAISSMMRRRIEVLHADGRTNGFGEYSGTPLLITYHKHAYTLGEHYNATGPDYANSDDDF